MQPLYILELIITLLTGFHPKTLCTSRAKKKKNPSFLPTSGNPACKLIHYSISVLCLLHHKLTLLSIQTDVCSPHIASCTEHRPIQPSEDRKKETNYLIQWIGLELSFVKIKILECYSSLVNGYLKYTLMSLWFHPLQSSTWELEHEHAEEQVAV